MIDPKERKELLEVRAQEMESILPNFYTIYLGKKIESKRIRFGNEYKGKAKRKEKS